MWPSPATTAFPCSRCGRFESGGRLASSIICYRSPFLRPAGPYTPLKSNTCARILQACTRPPAAVILTKRTPRLFSSKISALGESLGAFEPPMGAFGVVPNAKRAASKADPTFRVGSDSTPLPANCGERPKRWSSSPWPYGANAPQTSGPADLDVAKPAASLRRRSAAPSWSAMRHTLTDRHGGQAR